MWSRNEWINRSRFESGNDAWVLDRVRALVRAEPGSVVVLDLDSTLYDVAPRTFAIIREWLKAHGQDSRWTRRLRDKLENLERRHVRYSLKDLFEGLGISLTESSHQDAHDHLKAFWWDRFFSNDFLACDEPMPGAVAFSQELHALGANLAYLTGREQGAMLEGTERNLVRDGFPYKKERTALFMRSDPKQEDAVHKSETVPQLRSLGPVVASFENEPHNIVTLAQLLPEAMHVFVETVCSERPASAGHGLYRIRGFLTKP